MEKEMKPGVGVSVEGEEKLDPWSHWGADGKTNLSSGGGVRVWVRAQVKGLAFGKREGISSKDVLERDWKYPLLGECSLISVLKCH